MSRVIVLDSGPVGLLTASPKKSSAKECGRWLASLLAANNRVILPEIVDYEIRRELLRLGSKRGLRQLDSLAQIVEYIPLTTIAMRQAAELWSRARQQGKPTAGDKNIDADMILVGQAMSLVNATPLIATVNVRHLTLFTAAELWQNISPS